MLGRSWLNERDLIGEPPRVDVDDLGIVLIDVQPHFLKYLAEPEPLLVRLEQLLIAASWFQLPVVATVEAPTESKGDLPKRLEDKLPPDARRFTKQSYDLCRETEIHEAITGWGRSQVAVAGGETDVCALQSVLGLRQMGLTVFVLEDCLFSSETNVEPARHRMTQAGAVASTYKTLFYELVGSEQADLWCRQSELAAKGWIAPESLPPRTPS